MLHFSRIMMCVLAVWSFNARKAVSGVGNDAVQQSVLPITAENGQFIVQDFATELPKELSLQEFFVRFRYPLDGLHLQLHGRNVIVSLRHVESMPSIPGERNDFSMTMQYRGDADGEDVSERNFLVLESAEQSTYAFVQPDWNIGPEEYIYITIITTNPYFRLNVESDVLHMTTYDMEYPPMHSAPFSSVAQLWRDNVMTLSLTASAHVRDLYKTCRTEEEKEVLTERITHFFQNGLAQGFNSAFHLSAAGIIEPQNRFERSLYRVKGNLEETLQQAVDLRHWHEEQRYIKQQEAQQMRKSTLAPHQQYREMPPQGRRIAQPAFSNAP